MDKYQEIERSIIKKFRKQIWAKFIQAINDYDLIKDGDKIAVCISGGKDSMLLAKCMQEIKKHGKVNFELKFLIMNPGYNEKNWDLIKFNSETLNIPLDVFNTDIFNIVADIKDSPCYLCARMRRGYLYKNAQLLGCNKIALGHHFDDVIETILLSMFYGAEFKTMMPKLKSTNYKGMELIRPLYLVREKDILSWKKYNNLEFIQCACRFTESVNNACQDSKRSEIKELLAVLREKSDLIDMNIFRSIHNVNLDTIIGYKSKGKETSFLEHYNLALEEYDD